MRGHGERKDVLDNVIYEGNENEDETLECEQIHSKFEIDFYKEIRLVLTKFQFHTLFCLYIAFVILSMGITNWRLDKSNTSDTL